MKYLKTHIFLFVSPSLLIFFVTIKNFEVSYDPEINNKSQKHVKLILLGAQRVSVHSLHLQAFLACLHGTLTRVLLVWRHKLLLTCGLCCCGGGGGGGSMLLLLANHGLNVDSHVLLVLIFREWFFFYIKIIFCTFFSTQLLSFSIYLFSSMRRVFCVPLCYPGRYEM